MVLTLAIENTARLEGGAPAQMRLAAGESLDIGRDALMNWCLPDPNRVISGKHCEIRYRDGAYWLYDVSTNGTFVNNAARRLHAPHRLSDGDRIAIGPYVIAAALEEEPVDPIATSAPGSNATTPAAVTDVAPRVPFSAFRLDALANGKAAAADREGGSDQDGFGDAAGRQKVRRLFQFAGDHSGPRQRDRGLHALFRRILRARP